MNNRKKTIQYAFQKSIPIMTGYIVLGMGFGILLQKQGYGLLWAFLMSLCIYAGSMQYVTIDLLGSGASLVATALMTLMVNIRHVFYGITMLTKYQKAGRKKPYLIFALTDETFSVVCDVDLPEGVEENAYYFWISLLDQIYWVTGAAIGGICGSFIHFNTKGLDFVMTAMFVVIFLNQWIKDSKKGRGLLKDHVSEFVGLGASVVCLLIFGADSFIIPSMLVILAVLTLLRKKLEKMEMSPAAADKIRAKEKEDEQ